MKNFTFIFFAFVLFSCHKVEPLKDETNVNENKTECFIPEFTTYVTDLTVSLRGWDGLCGRSSEITISPFSPNPYWTGTTIEPLFQIPWSYNEFCQNVGAVMFYYLTANCKLPAIGQEIYSVGIYLQ